MKQSRLLPVPLTHLPDEIISDGSTGEIVGLDERIPLWADLLHRRGWRGSIRSVPIATAQDLEHGGRLPDWYLLDTSGLAAADLATVLPAMAERMRGRERHMLLTGRDEDPGGQDAPGTAEAEAADDSSWWERLRPETGRPYQWVVALDRFWASRVGDVVERLRPDRVSLLLPFPARHPRLCDALFARATRSLRLRGVEPSHCYTSDMTPIATWTVVDGLVAAHQSAYGADGPPLVLSPPMRDARGTGMLAAAHSWALPTLPPPPGKDGGTVRSPQDRPDGAFGARWLCMWDFE